MMFPSSCTHPNGPCFWEDDSFLNQVSSTSETSAPGENDFTCEDLETSCLPWHVPRGALLPLTYFVLGNSIGAYLLITWANRYARAGYVLAYTALQPFTSTLLSVLLIVAGVQGAQELGHHLV